MVPADVGLAGKADPVHLRRAIRESRTMLTHNNVDFRELHDLLIDAQGHHPGILVVCKENDRTRDMRPHDIVRAIANLLAAGMPTADQFITLNHWR
jgi:hypothetical protein